MVELKRKGEMVPQKWPEKLGNAYLQEEQSCRAMEEKRSMVKFEKFFSVKNHSMLLLQVWIVCHQYGSRTNTEAKM